ncbi:MAG: hypothetical protein KDA45_16560, partial [Planctomycetales bacterium]|nr:hypothetical protein [Planctomycetales bacterium]
MEVDRLGSPGSSPGGRYQLGPFSPGLNAVCGPRGSGKTTLLHWLRQLAAEDHPGDYAASDPAWLQPSPLPHRLPLAGSVEIENGDWRFRVHSDRGGRRQLQGIEPVSHGRHNHFEHTPLSFDQRQAFSPQQRAAFVGLASVSATGDSEAALTELAARLQLETTRSAASNDDQLQLRQRERELSTRLQQLRMPGSSREVLLARRDKLQAELQQAQQFAARENRYVGTAGDTRRLDERLAAIQAELREVEGQIEAQERELAELREELKSLETAQTTIEIDSSYRQQLQQLDDRLNRWRQTLRDLKVHRDRIDHDATNARLDQQIGDQLSVSKQPDPRASLRSLESQIMSARKQLDALVDRYRVFEDRPAEGQREYEIRRDAQGRTRIAYGETCPPLSEPSNLPETLRSMQHDLYEACQQLARHESQAAGDTLRQQAQQLQRCEAELLQSVEKLIEERAQ